MRRIWICAMVALFVLGGCTPGGDPVPSGTVVEPVVESNTPTPSPTPTWTGDELAAEEAVQKYWEVWARIGQNLDTADWNDIHEVADDTAVTAAFKLWADWASDGYHLVGSPSFITASVMVSSNDHRGTYYQVYGCYSIEGSTLIDSNGQSPESRGLERSIGINQVLHTTDGRFVVVYADYPDEQWASVEPPEFIDGAVEGLRRLMDMGFDLAIVSNQYPVGEGIITQAQLSAF